jgi:hypothetical protein
MRQRPVKFSDLRLGFSFSFELEESSLEKSRLMRAVHTRDIIILPLLLIPEAVLFLALAHAAGVVPVVVVALVGGGVELLPLGAVGDEVGGIAALKAAPK